jgi:hypothetical protein
MRADGNCQFRCIAHAVLGDQEQHRVVRLEMLEEMRTNVGRYFDFVAHVDQDYLTYENRMEKEGEWGDNLTARAMAERYGLEIVIVQRGPGGTLDEPGAETVRLPCRYREVERVIYLDFIAEKHYNYLFDPADSTATIGAGDAVRRHGGEPVEEARGETRRGDGRDEAERVDGRGEAGRGDGREGSGRGGRGAAGRARRGSGATRRAARS